MEDPATFPAAVWEVTGSTEAAARLKLFAQRLAAEGELRGLIGPREVGRLWSRHIVNSLVIVDLLPQEAEVADVGSGAGFPGVVIAAARPDLRVTLIEPMERRTRWLEEVVGELGLTNGRVLTARAEQVIGEEEFDVVTARAVARLDKLIPWTAPLARPGGKVLALKGERAAREIDEARKGFRRYGVEEARLHELISPLDGEVTRVVELLKGRRASGRK
ncbi:MAG TPA: 16S rRNA (guanine(527)-N(7))-methyltransferase RsmG [Actinomycetaceae bacterium]|nr:16S rRNA (guanine(527)-N(7))-methyltransferase RsmG [Actinomycetaceae bacterium]